MLPDDPRVRDVIVGRHDLGSYDELVRDDDDGLDVPAARAEDADG